MKTSTPIEMCKEADGSYKRTYKPKRENILKLELFLKNGRSEQHNRLGSRGFKQ
jgi:hypothetical protein